jgi:hypothetical protein
VLTSLAIHLGVVADIEVAKECLDCEIQWSQAKNVWQNAGIRTMLHYLTTPFRWTRS